MTQDNYRPSIAMSEIHREAREVKGDLTMSSATASGEDMEKIIRESIAVGVRLCGFEIGYDNSSSAANDSENLPKVSSPQAQTEINDMVTREEI